MAGQNADAVPGLSPSAADGAAAANRDAFGRTGLRQGPRKHAGPPETAVKILGRVWSAPLVVGPLDAPARPGGEFAVVKAAGAAGLPAVVSAFAERSFAELAPAADVPPWLRTYAFGDHETGRHLARRAEDAGFGALLLALGDRDDVRARGVWLPPPTSEWRGPWTTYAHCCGSAPTGPTWHGCARRPPCRCSSRGCAPPRTAARRRHRRRRHRGQRLRRPARDRRPRRGPLSRPAQRRRPARRGRPRLARLGCRRRHRGPPRARRAAGGRTPRRRGGARRPRR
ncbi:hypothetical protein SALBM135S_09504 [Streptomyces alboniger]